MSEQPASSNIYDLSQRRLKADGSLEMGPETDVLLHASRLPRNNTSFGNGYSEMNAKAKVTELNPEIEAIRNVRREVSNLAIIRRAEAA